MKRVCVGLVLCMIFCAGVSIAAEISFEAEIVATAEELTAIAGGDEIEAQVLAVDTDGDLIVFCDAGKRVRGALLEIDVTRRPVTGSVIILELGPGSLNEGQREPRLEDINFSNIVVSSDGTIWGGDYQGADEILAIRRGDKVMVESLFEVPGINGMALGRDQEGNEALFWIEEKCFQSDDNVPGRNAVEGLHIYPLPSGPPSLLIPPEVFRTATNNPEGPGLHELAVASDGSFAVSFDKSRKSRKFLLHGTDQLLRMILFPINSAEVDIPYSLTFFGEKPFFGALTIDENGTIYGWNKSGGDRTRGQLEILKEKQRWTITASDLKDKLNVGSFGMMRGGLRALAQVDGSVIIYAINSDDGSIVKIVLPPGASSITE